jgi:hypothetical protein
MIINAQFLTGIKEFNRFFKQENDELLKIIPK